MFCPTKRFLENAFRNTRAKAEELGLDPDRVSAFHADLKNERRQDIQQDIKAGRVNIVFTTNALELGLDIGGLDGVILAGFPASTMSAWQQIGRAGRGWDKDAFVLFYAMNDPIDRFFVGNLRLSSTGPSTNWWSIHPTSNLSTTTYRRSPTRPTARSLPLKRTSSAPRSTPRLHRGMGKPIRGFAPHANMNLRGGLGPSFKLKRANEEIGQISAMRRFREAYIGAVFTFFGHKYRVHSHEEGRRPHRRRTARQNRGRFLQRSHNHADLSWVRLRLGTGVLRRTQHRDELHGVPPYRRTHLGTAGIGRHSQRPLREQPSRFPTERAPHPSARFRGRRSLGAPHRVGAMFVIPADRFDTSTFSKPNEDPAAVFFYENYSGSIGVAKKLAEVWPRALAKGIEVAENCPCEHGCPNCIEPAKSYNMSKRQHRQGHWHRTREARPRNRRRWPRFRGQERPTRTAPIDAPRCA